MDENERQALLERYGAGVDAVRNALAGVSEAELDRILAGILGE